jgi:hypothetical protein
MYVVLWRNRSFQRIWPDNEVNLLYLLTNILPESREDAFNNGVYILFTQTFD